MTLPRDGLLRTYRLTTTAELRDNRPPDKQITFSELPGHSTIRTGNVTFDGLYAMAISEACANAVSQISDDSYAKGKPIRIEVFQTGELWKYVWTRDLSYSLQLGLAGFDPLRAVNSLLFKASRPKATVSGGGRDQIVQDTGSGGSYPVSTDRVVWALGAHETLKYLSDADRQTFLLKVYPILCGTIEQDRRLVFDPSDGLYRGEQSFLDWREQTYPGWIRDNVLAIAMSKALSVNAANYILLTHAAEYSRMLGKTDAQAQFARWAYDLRAAINGRFFDAKSGLYLTYLLSDDGSDTAVGAARYDLLGESLAILSGIADERQASSVLENYPTGPYGPPVVWPQEKTVPIYHNQGIWPFVTAYWIKAARQAGHAAAVDAGIHSLVQEAAANLSNMENFDFVSGAPDVKNGLRTGPKVNSRRQLWSVAGYFSMVQDVVFGLETSYEGIRFCPFITAKLRHETFQATDVIEWRGFTFQGTQNCVRVHLPPIGSFGRGVCTVDRVELNRKTVGADFVKTGDLQSINDWEIFLNAPDQAQPPAAPLRVVEVDDERKICGPIQPRWRAQGQGGIMLEDNRLVLHYEHDDLAHVAFDIYRDGQLRAGGIRQTRWMDPDSGDYHDTVHTYRVAAVDIQSGNHSHLTPSLSYRTLDHQQVIPANSLRNRGGNLVESHHFENWGRFDDEMIGSLTVNQRGRYFIRVEFSNGAGSVNTGITCAVKKLEVSKTGSGNVVAAGYLVMPQSGDSKRFDLSSAVTADLESGVGYVLRLSEDEWSRNMSYLESNARYTASAGGGATSYNYVNIGAMHVLYAAATDPTSKLTVSPSSAVNTEPTK